MSGTDPAAASPPTPRGLTRRGLLGLGAGLTAAVAGVTGCSAADGDGPLPPGFGPRPQPTCVRRASLPRYARLADLPLVYEVNRRRAEFSVDQGFAGQLEVWLTDLKELTGWRLRQLWTYGTWTEGGTACSSWHDAGRAFDLARLRLEDGTDVSCRYDLWRDASGRDLTRARRVYWAVAASAHQHFAYVLTYLYDATHHNHIHLDNGRSGAGRSVFSSRSPAQVQAVQGILTHLWDRPVPVTGRFDAPTREATRAVLDELGVGDDLADRSTWAGFLTAGVRRGADRD